MQEWRFFVKSEESYKFFQFVRKSRVVNSISKKKRRKKLEKIFFLAHQSNLIQSVENNLTIILVQEWRFFIKSEQSYNCFQFFRKSGVIHVNSISEKKIQENCFMAYQNNLIQSVVNNLTIILV